MFSLSSNKTSMVGVDISSTSVKILELSGQPNKYRVESYAVEPLPANAVVEKNITDIDAVADTLKKAMKRSGSKTKRCILAVPASEAISKMVSMPANLSEDEMESQIQLEADQYIPYSLEEVSLDFEVLGTNPNNPDTVDVLLVASRTENVETRVSIAELAGLSSDIVDIESYAMENAHTLIRQQIGSSDDHVSAVIDIGATMTSINVMSSDQLIYTREQAFGGRQLTEEIMRRFGLSYEEAGLAKKEGGLADNYVPEVLNPFKETITQQVHRLLQFFYAASQYNEVDKIILAGGCASIPGIDEQVEAATKVDTYIANPFSKMKFSSKIDQQRLGNDAPAMMIACGLAVRSVS